MALRRYGKCLGGLLLPKMKRKKELAGQELEFDKSLLVTHALLLTWMAILSMIDRSRYLRVSDLSRHYTLK